MNDAALTGVFFDGAAALCAVMAVVNGLRYRSRGPAAFALSLAFLALGTAVLAYRRGGPDWLFPLCGIVCFACLAADFYFRAPAGRGR